MYKNFEQQFPVNYPYALLAGLGRKKEVYAIDAARMRGCIGLLADRHRSLPRRRQEERLKPRQIIATAVV